MQVSCWLNLVAALRAAGRRPKVVCGHCSRPLAGLDRPCPCWTEGPDSDPTDLDDLLDGLLAAREARSEAESLEN